MFLDAVGQSGLVFIVSVSDNNYASASAHNVGQLPHSPRPYKRMTMQIEPEVLLRIDFSFCLGFLEKIFSFSVAPGVELK